MPKTPLQTETPRAYFDELTAAFDVLAKLVKTIDLERAESGDRTDLRAAMRALRKHVGFAVEESGPRTRRRDLDNAGRYAAWAEAVISDLVTAGVVALESARELYAQFAVLKRLLSGRKAALNGTVAVTMPVAPPECPEADVVAHGPVFPATPPNDPVDAFATDDERMGSVPGVPPG